MRNNKNFFSEEIYSQYLSIINGINFTPREIDIVSYLVNARGASKAASALEISPNTVLSHIRNIMSKLGCNSRERILDFFEKTGKIHFLREYNERLLIEFLFVNLLRDCLKSTFKGTLSSCVVLCSDSHLKNVFINHLKKHLARAGLEIPIIDGDEDFNANCLRGKGKSHLIFIKAKTQKIWDAFPETAFLEIHEHEDYYLMCLEILQRIFPGNILEPLFKTFFEEYGLLKGFVGKLYETQHTAKGLVEKKDAQKWRERGTFQVKNWLAILGVGSIIILLLGLQIIKETTKMQVPPLQEDIKGRPIRSDMIIPTESGFLHRPQALEKLDNIFKKEQAIQSLAIIGPGGAGKTVLARQYARQQHAPVIWEINAETSETLNASFENLAHALATSEENKKRLGEIHDIKNPKRRENHLIHFVKDRLKACSHWFLLYDNVEKFTDIQKYFPQDSSTWGRGRIILTTRDKNIQNHTHINNSLHIHDLTREEKLHLFLKIMADEEDSLFSASQKENAKKFLENIPPYPLDVSIAAYYLKSTHLSYEKYLENLLQNPKEFTETQKNILKEAGDYSKTRYEIITLALQKLIDLDPSFGELFFLISLLDSQNIPRDLLDTYKNPVVVDNFIYHLKK